MKDIFYFYLEGSQRRRERELSQAGSLSNGWPGPGHSQEPRSKPAAKRFFQVSHMPQCFKSTGSSHLQVLEILLFIEILIISFMTQALDVIFSR